MEAIFANLRTNSKTKHQGIRCLKYFEINFNASNRVEQGCRAQMSGTRKLKTGSHLAGSKKKYIFLRQHKLDNGTTMGKSWQIILYVDRFGTPVSHKCLDPGCGKLQSHCIGNARMQEKINGSGNVCNMLQNIHRPKLPNLLLRELAFWYFLTSITHAVRVVLHETSSSWNNSIDVWKRENRKIATNRETNPSLMPIHLSKSSLFLKPPWDPVTHERESWMMMGGVSRVYIFLDSKCFPYRATKYQTCTCTGHW